MASSGGQVATGGTANQRLSLAFWMHFRKYFSRSVRSRVPSSTSSSTPSQLLATRVVSASARSFCSRDAWSCSVFPSSCRNARVRRAWSARVSASASRTSPHRRPSLPPGGRRRSGAMTARPRRGVPGPGARTPPPAGLGPPSARAPRPPGRSRARCTPAPATAPRPRRSSSPGPAWSAPGAPARAPPPRGELGPELGDEVRPRVALLPVVRDQPRGLDLVASHGLRELAVTALEPGRRRERLLVPPRDDPRGVDVGRHVRLGDVVEEGCR